MKFVKQYENFNQKITNYNQKKLPNEVYLNGKKYVGDVAFINGYNGYTSTDDDSLLCAVIGNSAFIGNKPNLVTDEFGSYIYSTDRRGTTLTY
jgi:hypothetical protein